MKVRELVKDSVWMPGASFDGIAPRISVLLPTFRRGGDGLFLKAARSILQQSLQDLELIIIDDASTDGTADQIARLMKADGRVSCIKHPLNIGLPAVSEYEGYKRARGRYIGFGFDDFVFRPDAFKSLLAAAETNPDSVVHGYIEWFDRHGRLHRLGRDDAPHELLTFSNFLGNASFLVDRAVLDEVGLYDPHIAAARLCDWDLWRRILRRYPLERVDVFVGREHGVSRADSLGNTYPLTFEAMPEYFNIDRDDALRAEAFEDFDVWNVPSDATAPLTRHILASRRFFAGKAWARDLSFVDEGEVASLFDPKKLTLGVFGNLDASLSFFFDGVANTFDNNIVYINAQMGDDFLQRLLATCDAVILVRGLLDARSHYAISLCIEAGIPLYYFIDDNFIILSQDHQEFASFSTDNVRRTLQRFEGVFCGSPLLAEYYHTLDLHWDVQELRLCLDPVKAAKLQRIEPDKGDDDFRVGFIGGEFRQRALRQNVVPALAALAEDSEISFYSRWAPPKAETTYPFAIKDVPFSASTDEFLVRWRRLGLHAIVHPAGDTENISFKNENVMLIAHYLGAVPVVPQEEAFAHVSENDGVIKVADRESDWEAAMRRLMDSAFRQKMRERLRGYCETALAPHHNADTLDRTCFGERADSQTARDEHSKPRLRTLDTLEFESRLRKMQAPVGSAWMEAEFQSRSYKLALKIRRAASAARRVRSSVTRLWSS